MPKKFVRRMMPNMPRGGGGAPGGGGKGGNPFTGLVKKKAKVKLKRKNPRRTVKKPTTDQKAEKLLREIGEVKFKNPADRKIEQPKIKKSGVKTKVVDSAIAGGAGIAIGSDIERSRSRRKLEEGGKNSKSKMALQREKNKVTVKFKKKK